VDFYLLLTGVTTVILLLAWLVWSRTRHLSFPLGIGLIYYWSLFGAWSIVQDRLGGASGKRYDYLEAKLFPVMLDEHYLMTLLLYAAFIILIEIALLLFLKPGPLPDEPGRPRSKCPMESCLAWRCCAGWAVTRSSASPWKWPTP
jgi:hypothetical protein